MKTTLEILEAVDQVFSDESKWISGELALDAKYERVPPNSPNATCFCLDGAISHVLGIDTYPPDSHSVVRALASCLQPEYVNAVSDPVESLYDLNDGEGFAAVKQLIADAIAAERLAEQKWKDDGGAN